MSLTRMARYRRQTRLEAPLEEVWQFHSTVEGLTAVTPDWFDLRVESITGPDGAADPTVLEAGSTVELSMQPLGVGPRQRWTSRITERERQDDLAWFRDEMRTGPFPHWLHTHRFRADGDATVMTDAVDYQLPVLPAAFAPLGRPFFEPLFAYRHRRTRQLLEGAAPR